MPSSIRVRLDPVPWPPGGASDKPTVVRLRPSFTLFGSGATAANTQPKHAKLEFKGRLWTAQRNPPAPHEVALGELEGELVLVDRRVKFLCDPASLAKLAPAEDDTKPTDEPHPNFSPRSIELSLDSEFDGLGAVTGRKATLQLSNDTGQFRYLEVVVSLTIDGAVEADFDTNDRFDVPIRREPQRLQPPFSL